MASRFNIYSYLVIQEMNWRYLQFNCFHLVTSPINLMISPSQLLISTIHLVISTILPRPTLSVSGNRLDGTRDLRLASVRAHATGQSGRFLTKSDR